MKVYLKVLTVLCFLSGLSFTEEEKSDVIPFEKVYLHLDRHFYLSGDDIWFKAYLVDAQTNKLSQKSSRILYTELISPESKLLMRRVLYVDSDGCSIGDFKLKENFVSGKYRIRAYTKWMLNFGDVFVFDKEIEVRNISNETDLKLSSSKKKSKDKNDNPNETVITREDVEIEFFPESGSLISGIENVVAFKANDWSGKGAEVSGGVFNSNGDTVALFASEYLGMGKFSFTPQAGELYQVFFVPKDVAYSLYAKFPESLDNGFTLNITDNDTVFILNIRTNHETFDEFSGKKILLMFRQSEEPLLGHETLIKNNSEIVYLPKSLLPTGITRITLYDNQGKPHCERLVYIENKEKINVNITPASDTTSTIKVTDDKGNPLQAYLSISITNSIVPDETFDIESYFRLESEIKGKIERVSAYFDTANVDRFKQIDLLLLTQGWRDFVWKHLENDISEFAGYEMEKGLKITGHVEKTIGKKPYPDANVFMYVPHLEFGKWTKFLQADSLGNDDLGDLNSSGYKMIHLNSRVFLHVPNQEIGKWTKFVQTDSLGNYDLGYLNFSGYKMIHLSSRTKKGKKAGEISVNPLYMPVEQFPVKVWTQYFTDSISVFSVGNYSRKNYKLSDTIILDPVTITDRKEGYLLSDREITPKDESRWMSLDYYLKGKAPSLLTARMETKTLNSTKITFYDSNGKKMKSNVPHPSKISMKEIERVRIYARHTIPSVGEVPPEFSPIAFTKSIYSIDVYSKYDGFTEQNYPIEVLMNGMSEGARIAEVVSAEGYYEETIKINPDYYNGFIPRYDGDSRGTHTVSVDKIDYSHISSLMGGFYEERKFYSPEFYSIDDCKDYFGTFYWQADIRTDTNGECVIYHNLEKQPSGKIRIEGITKDGIPFAIDYLSPNPSPQGRGADSQ
jgi:hypothetical protein